MSFPTNFCANSRMEDRISAYTSTGVTIFVKVSPLDTIESSIVDMPSSPSNTVYDQLLRLISSIMFSNLVPSIRFTS